MSKGGRYAKQKGSSGGRIALIVMLIVLIVAAAVLSGMLLFGAKNREQLQTPETTESVGITEASTEVQTEAATEATTEPTTVPTTLPYKESGKDIINVLLIGQQAREGEAEADQRMADTMILVTVNKTTKTMYLHSFLRDTYVKLPDYVDPSGKTHPCGRNRINVCYNLGYQWGGAGGAMEMTNQCLKENFGIEVDYDVEVSFQGFMDIIDKLGGVQVELTEAEADYLNKDSWYVFRELQPGKVWLEGSEALSYARMRKAEGDGDSDIKRTERQRKVITSVFNSLKGMSIGQFQEMAEEFLPMITTNMTNEDITTCLWEIVPLLPQLTIETGTCPVQTTYWGEIIDLFGVPSSVLKFDQGQNTRLMQAITEGIPAE